MKKIILILLTAFLFIGQQSFAAADEMQLNLISPDSQVDNGFECVGDEPFQCDLNLDNPEDYKKKVESIIKKSYSKQKFFIERYLVLEIFIEKNGEISKIEVIHSSNNKKFDEFYINAIQKCVFPPVPDSISKGKAVISYVVRNKKPCSLSESFLYNFKSEVMSIIGR